MILKVSLHAEDGSRSVMVDTRKVDVVEDVHGTEVADPYRWLEEDNDETAAWVRAQNRMTATFLGQIDEREAIRNRLAELWDFPRYSIPIKAGGRYFFSQNAGLQNQPVYIVQEGLDGESRSLIDPNELSEDGTVALTSAKPNLDGGLLAYGTSESGSDWQEIRVRRVSSGEDLPAVIRWTKFHNIAWKPDSSGFYYNRLPEPGSVPPEDQNHYSRVCWHEIGTPVEQDVIVYERPDFKQLRFMPEISDDGRYLILTGHVGTDPETRIYYREVDSDGEFVRLLDEADAEYEFVDSEGDTFYMLTSQGAPRMRLVAIDLNNPSRDTWREVIPEFEDETIYSVVAAGDSFVLFSLHNAHYRVRLYRRDGTFARELELPGIGSVPEGAVWGRPGDDELFLAFTSFLYPPTPYRVQLPDGELERLHEFRLDFDRDAYETRQIFATSKHGTQVPLFVTHRKGLELDGSAPAWLYAYGGFNVAITPSFEVAPLYWLEQGGVYAVAVLRGGGEFGDEWHRAGMLEKKQNVFDDFIACAEHLISEGYTSRAQLVINGRSNGGLLTAACLTQRPDLFGAVVCEVPVIDMLRYHRFSAGHFWIGEYGDPENPEHFRFLRAYSPLHNVKSGESYPPTLITTADTDDRVVPGHARKFAAMLQAAQSGDAPILLRVEEKAGHGHGKPVSKQIAEQADLLALMSAELERSR